MLVTKETLFDKCIPVTESGCWLWTGAWSKQGYGNLWDGEKYTQAHRSMLILCSGKESTNLHVLHKCDTPACCNPDHLFFGTYQDNHSDMVAKGRSKCGDINRKRTHCKNGHPLQQLTWSKQRGCVVCINKLQAERARKRRAAERNHVPSQWKLRGSDGKFTRPPSC